MSDDFMTTFRQISEVEWKKGDFRPCAMIHRTSEKLLANFQVNFKEYWEDGLGKAKIAFFISSNNTQFAIREITETSVPITEIAILNAPATYQNDFIEVLKLLDLKSSDLDDMYKW